MNNAISDYTFKYNMVYKKEYFLMLCDVDNADIKDLLDLKNRLLYTIKDIMREMYNNISSSNLEEIINLKEIVSNHFFLFKDNIYPSIKMNSVQKRLIYFILYLIDNNKCRLFSYSQVIFFNKRKDVVKIIFDSIEFKNLLDASLYIESKYYQYISTLKEYFGLYFEIKDTLKKLKKDRKSRKSLPKLFVDKTDKLNYFPNRLPSAKNLILTGKLRDLYLSDKWELGRKYKNVTRSWKRHRKTQYKNTKSAIIDEIYEPSNLTIKEKLDGLWERTSLRKLNKLYMLCEIEQLIYKDLKNSPDITELLNSLKEDITHDSDS